MAAPAATVLAAAPVTLDLSVDTTLDPDPANTATSCESPCSLRKAVNLANRQLPGTVTVVHVPSGTYTLTRQPDATDARLGGSLALTQGRVEVRGAGAATTIIEQGPRVDDRVFDISTTARINGVTIRHGRAPSGSNYPARVGAGILVESRGALELERSVVTANSAPGGSSPQAGFGGGIAIAPSSSAVGPSTLRDVTVSENTAQAGGAGVALLRGTLTVISSTISGNRCLGEDTPCGGGGIYTTRTLRVVNSTLDGNVADQGGGVYVDMYGVAQLTNATLSDNRLPSPVSRAARHPRKGRAAPALPILDGAALYVVGGFGTRATLASSIVAGNPLDECGVDTTNLQPTDPPSVASAGYNIEDGLTCALTGPTDKPLTDAKLSPLQDNGGPTKTRAIGPGSPALDAVSPTTCPAPARDQRNILRANAGARTGTACDIGAFEYQAPAPLVVPSPTPTSVVQDVIIYVLVTPRLPQAGHPVAAAVLGDPRPLLALPIFVLLSLLAWLAYHVALRDRRGDT
ncbi:MAG: CSLREA domain-containing protein [Candidatus Dormibacteria bacterium]